MSSVIRGARVPIRVWAKPHEIEAEALRQLKAVAALPWVAHHVAVMPDVHVGKGATVGSVIALRGAVAPAAVGVDIGCGMAALPTNLRAADLPDSLSRLRLAIEDAIPIGRGMHRSPAFESVADSELERVSAALLGQYSELRAHTGCSLERASCQLGTLGGGNHFIEVCLDTEQTVWLMLHSGSRHLGAALAEFHMERASKLGHNQALEDPDLAVFIQDTPPFQAYRHDLYFAQSYAALNRELMLALLRQVMRKHFRKITFGETISCHHNYVSEEHHFGEDVLITRKGAIRARNGELGIIPGSMGARSYIVRGLGNPLSFESASHGAGRRLSRTQARKSFTLADLRRQTQGVECRQDSGVLDEAPKAYKNIEQVMEQQRDLVEVVAELKQVVCVKG